MLGPRYSISDTRLSRYESYDRRQREVLQVLQVLQQPHDLQQLVLSGASVIFYGGIGTGKDHLLANLLYCAAVNYTVSWVPGGTLLADFLAGVKADAGLTPVLRKYAEPYVLGISDLVLPAGQGITDYSANSLYQLVDLRYRARKCTWFTVNCASLDDLEIKLTSQTMDRLRHGAVLLPCFWESYRTRERK